MSNIIVKNVQVADPQVSFQITFDSAPDDTVLVKVTMTGPHGNNYVSELNILNPVTDTSLNFTLPFGDANYKSGSNLDYDIFVSTAKFGPQVFSGTVVAG